MREEKGVAIVAYKQNSRRPRFLVLKRKKNWEGWELPKGHLENDDYRETAKLELGEEAGIEEKDIEEMEEMDYDLTWEFEEDGEKVRRKYRGFIVKVKESTVPDTSGNPHEEHEKGHFFRGRDVESLLTYENQVELLKKAREKISSS